jgi:hypothetical protein
MVCSRKTILQQLGCRYGSGRAAVSELQAVLLTSKGDVELCFLALGRKVEIIKKAVSSGGSD